MVIHCPTCHSENPDTQKFCGECGAPLPQLVSCDGKPGIPGDVRASAEPGGQGPNSPASDSPPSNAKDLPAKVTETFRTPVKELARGTLFAGRFEVIEELGKGGMGKVYRVFDKKADEEVALKLIKPEIAAEQDVIGRFRSELRMSRRISHRNVSRMYDIGDEDGTHYITMEYVPGEDLRSFIRRSRQLSVGTAISIAKQVAEGLAEAHRLGVVHRDLKPSNIMIDREGNAKIMDFGIARSLAEKGITGAGMIIGTPEYMSPEQVEGKGIDQKSDIYSLGIVLYEMVTGRRPFEGETPLSVAHKQKYEAPADPRDLNPQVPEDLGRLILRSLEKDKGKRHQSAEELHSELTRLEKEIPTTERTVLKRKPTKSREMAVGKGKVRRAKIVLFGCAVVILAIIIYAGLNLLPRRGEVIDSIAVLPFENVNADPNTDYLSDGITETIINKLSPLSGFKRVINRASVFTYKGKTVDPKTVGRELGVKAVLLTRMVRLGDRLTISPTLVRTRDNSQLWGERYDRKFEDILSIEEDIAASIVQALRLKLTKQDQQRISERPIDNVTAYESYLKANSEVYRYQEGGLDRVAQDLQKALDITGPNPLLYSAMANAYWQYVNIGAKQEEYLAKAEDYANKALALNPNSSQALSVLAVIRWYSDPHEAIRYFRRALAVNPNDPDALFRLGLLFFFSGRPAAAVPLHERLRKTDPLNPNIHFIEGAPLFFEGQFVPALDPYRKQYESDPHNPNNGLMLFIVLAYNNKFDEALSVIDASARVNTDNAFIKFGLLMKYGLQKDREMAFQLMTPDFRKTCLRDCEWSYYVADAFALLDEKKEALDWLENAVNRGFINYPFISRHDTFLDNIRGEERFRKLMERVKYEWERFEE